MKKLIVTAIAFAATTAFAAPFGNPDYTARVTATGSSMAELQASAARWARHLTSGTPACVETQSDRENGGQATEVDYGRVQVINYADGGQGYSQVVTVRCWD